MSPSSNVDFANPEVASILSGAIDIAFLNRSLASLYREVESRAFPSSISRFADQGLAFSKDVNKSIADLKSLFFMNNGVNVEVQLVALSSKGNDYAKKDTWELNAEGWKLVNSEFAGVSTQVVYDNPNEVELPKGNIIINNKELSQIYK